MSGSPDQLHRLGQDVTSSATALLDRAAAALRAARERGPRDLERAAAGVCRAQPSMGGLWNLAAAALDPDPAGVDDLLRRARRAPASIARQAGDLCGPAEGTRRAVTCSRSMIVEACVRVFAAQARSGATPGFSVRCAESRPGLEGRALAAALAADGIRVEVVTDAAIAADLGLGDVVLVGADAVAADWFINKAGTAQLCAAALLAGVPAYVLAGREKFVAEPIARALALRQHDPREVWADPPAGVSVANPLFERVPLASVAGVLTDVGLLAGDMVRAMCESRPEPAARRLLAVLA